jgi:type IV pilus assembly protein PilM
MISQMVREAKIKNHSVATAVSGHSVIVKQISMPTMSEEELEVTMESEAAQHIPFELTDVNLDYHILDVKENGNMDVLLVAVKKDKVTNFTSALSMAGMVASVMDHDPFCVQNCYEYNYQPAPGATVALLNVGASVTNINVVKGTTPLFTRDVSVGGNQYTDALQKELALSFEDAETAKLGRNASVTDDRRMPVLQSVSDIIRLEIQKTFDFFRASASGEHIERLYLSGGSAQVPGLTDMLRQEFAVPVELMDPFRRINYDQSSPASTAIHQYGPRLAVAVGLALRSFEDL